VTFDKLDDWSKRPEDSIKYYSGTATYRTAFDASRFTHHASRLLLDLGKVAVMAQVKLNGKDLGIVWTPPYRVDVTGAVRAGENTLEIRVANLWPNRLIGDAGLPVEKRLTWTTFNPYKATSPLFESGLLGPVTLQPVEEGTSRP
jgi:hypothetical protein